MNKQIIPAGGLSTSSVVVAVKEQIHSNLAGETVILNLDSGVYYGLNEVGSRVWEMVQEPVAVNAIRDALLEEYKITADDCEKELLSLLETLAENRLIEVKHEASA
jgi:hypothetical protein